MYYLDSLRDKDGGDVYRTKVGFKYPLSKDHSGLYKVKSGEMLRVCMTSDFFGGSGSVEGRSLGNH